MRNIAQRISHLKKTLEAAEKDPGKRSHRVKNWRGSSLSRTTIRVDADYLMYRIENGRTRRQQLAYLKEHDDLPKSLFDDPESKKAQEAQREILLAMVRESGQDFLNDLKTRGQEDPAIVTSDGFIVNGNRRVAALTELGQNFIECVVLPDDTTPRDIYELEQTLQVAKDFREDYHWVNELITIRDGIKDKRLHFDEREQARILRRDKKEVQARLTMLDLVDAFLAWRKTPKEYDCVKLDDAEQIFIDLESAMRKDNSDAKLQTQKRNFVFTFIEERPGKGRLYGHVKDILRNFDKLSQRIAADPAFKPKKGKKNANKPEPDLGIPAELMGDEPTPTIGRIEDAKELSAALLENIADLKAETKQLRDNEAFYDSISDSLRSLQGLLIDTDTTKLKAARAKLEQIIKVSHELIADIDSQGEDIV